MASSTLRTCLSPALQEMPAWPLWTGSWRPRRRAHRPRRLGQRLVARRARRARRGLLNSAGCSFLRQPKSSTSLACRWPSNGSVGRRRSGTLRPVSGMTGRRGNGARREPGTLTEPRFLIVNADDLGLTEAVNAGIFIAWERGIVTSASLMVRQGAAGGGPGCGRAPRAGGRPASGPWPVGLRARRVASRLPAL